MLRQKPTILCIDDEWNQLIGYKELLEGTGYKVLAATNGGDGLEMFHSNSVDAVILDYRMPGNGRGSSRGPNEEHEVAGSHHAAVRLSGAVED